MELSICPQVNTTMLVSRNLSQEVMTSLWRIELLSDSDWVRKCYKKVIRHKTAQAQSSVIYDLGNRVENISHH